MQNKIIIDRDLSDEIVLWRYMSLEKFIHLIDTCTIFLSPISFFKNSDPLEGHLPKKFHFKYESIFESMRNESIKIQECLPDDLKASLQEWQVTSSLRFEKMREKSRGRQCICCWYESQFESEAMWKLYGDNGKSIAIKTTVGALRKSIESEDNKNLVFLSRIKYLNFNDNELMEEDLFTKDKAIAGILLKRKEYEHEKEIRLYHKPHEYDLLSPQNTVFTEYWEKYEIKPHFVNVDINQLIYDVVISPFVSQPYISSVEAICSKYELNNCKVYQSDLLNNYDL